MHLAQAFFFFFFIFLTDYWLETDLHKSIQNWINTTREVTIIANALLWKTKFQACD